MLRDGPIDQLSRAGVVVGAIMASSMRTEPAGVEEELDRGIRTTADTAALFHPRGAPQMPMRKYNGQEHDFQKM